MVKKILISFIFIIAFENVFPQKSDSLNTKFLIASTSIYSVAALTLSYVWYTNYSHSSFHFFNDGNEWLQMDKAGHFFSSFQINRVLHNNVHDENLIISTGVTQLYMSTIEVMDAFQKDWGFSLWDVCANMSGSAFFIVKEKFRLPVTLKFSFYPAGMAKFNPDLLGGSVAEQLIKDYNSQTYWLSIDVPDTRFITLDFGYSADGLIGGRQNPVEYAYIKRVREFYLSAGINLSNIKTRKKWLKIILNTLNVIKIPFPAIRYTNNGGLKFIPVYF